MDEADRRAKEREEWENFREWAKRWPVASAFAEYRRLAGQGNYYALQWELEIEASHKSGISRPSFWDNPGMEGSVSTRGGTRSMPYSGMSKG